MSQVAQNKFVGLGSNRGLSLIEMMIALALLGVVTVAAYAVGRTTITSTSRVSRNIVDALNTDISVRGLNYEVSNSEVMRKKINGQPAVTCSAKALLGADQLGQNRSFGEIGDGFSFVYASRRLVAATSLEQSSAIVVPDVQPFYVGAVILLTSLDGSKLQSFYSVSSIDDGTLTVKLTQALPQTPAAIGCTLNSAGADNTMLNPLNARKFSVDIMAFVRYEVEEDTSIHNGKKLVAKLWPLRNFLANKDGGGADVVHSSPVVDRFQRLDLNETFTPTTTTKGEYNATFKIAYSQPILGVRTADADRVLDFKTGYRLTGVEVANNAAIPDPPSVEKAYVTCSVISTPIQNTYVRQSDPKEFSTIFRIEALYSESDTLGNGNVPSITAFVSQNSPGGDPIQCWRAQDIQNYLAPGQLGPMMTGVGLGSSFSFEKANSSADEVQLATNSLVNPVYCYIPSDSQIKASLRYVQVTPDGYTPQTVNCSPIDIKGTPNEWTYDAGGPSKCSRDGGIFIGQLVGIQDPGQVGPQLVADSCEWSESSSLSCNSFAVLSDRPQAQLQRVKFNPSGLKIDGATVSEITCE